MGTGVTPWWWDVGMRDISDLAQKAASQHGLLTHQQLTHHGWSRHAIANLVDRGQLIRLSRATFVMAGAPLSREQDVMRACVSVSPWADASHRTALWLWGMRSVDDDIDIAVRYPRGGSTPLATVHRSRDLRSFDRTWIEGIPVTTPARTLCDAGLVLPEVTVRGLVQHAVASGIVTVGELTAYRKRVGRPGRNGAGVLGRILEDTAPDLGGAESAPEAELRRTLRHAGLPPGCPQHPVKAGGRHYRIDLAYPDARLAVEFDGYVSHTSPRRFVDDRRRQNDLMTAGWTVLRFTHRDLRDRPGAVIAQIRSRL